MRGSRGPGPSQPHSDDHHWENSLHYQLIKQSKNKSQNAYSIQQTKLAVGHLWKEVLEPTAHTVVTYICDQNNCTILPLQTKSSNIYHIDVVHVVREKKTPKTSSTQRCTLSTRN